VVIEEVRLLVWDSGATVKVADSGEFDCSECELERECVGWCCIMGPSIVDRDSREYTLRPSCRVAVCAGDETWGDGDGDILIGDCDTFETLPDSISFSVIVSSTDF